MHDFQQAQAPGSGDSSRDKKANACPVGDDGFQSMTARFTGPSLTPGDLGNLHELVLLQEFLEGPRGHPNLDANDKNR
jgi:hypothetical protein